MKRPIGRKTYDFDRATIGAFSGRTNRMLKAYVKLLSMTGKADEADKMLQETLGTAHAFYPGDNQTVVDFITTLAEYRLDRDELETAIPLVIDAVRIQTKVGKSEEKGRLLAREALLASLGAKRQTCDGSIRAQVFCAMEDLWRPPRVRRRIRCGCRQRR